MDIFFIICMILTAFIFGINSFAHGTFTPQIDFILSIILILGMIYGIYIYGFTKGGLLIFLLLVIIKITFKKNNS